MAGNVKPIVYNWILDYFCSCAWEEFKTSKKLSASLVDSLSGILCQEWEGDVQRYNKKLFLITLSRIADGENITLRYEDDDLSPLEDLLPNFMKLVDLQLNEDLVTQGHKMYTIIRIEAVSVYLREKEYKLAQNCFNRLFLDKNKELLKLKSVKKLKNLITEKKHLDIEYSMFVDAMIYYLQTIVDQFDKPLLIQAAECHLESQKPATPTSVVTRKAAVSCIEENKKNKNNSGTNVGEEKKKLRSLWNKNISDMFGQPSPEKNDAAVMMPPPPPSTRPTTAATSIARDSKAATKRKASPLPSTSKTSPNLTRPPIQFHPLTPSPAKKKLFESPHKKAKNKTPSKDPSPEVVYKKNKGRFNRHDPSSIVSSSKCSDIDNISIISSVSGGMRKKWTNEEMEEFFNAVQTFGVGKWAEIKEYIGTSRTSVMLKDKWRTMVKSGDADMLNDAYQKKKRKK